MSRHALAAPRASSSFPRPRAIERMQVEQQMRELGLRQHSRSMPRSAPTKNGFDVRVERARAPARSRGRDRDVRRSHRRRKQMRRHGLRAICVAAKRERVRRAAADDALLAAADVHEDAGEEHREHEVRPPVGDERQRQTGRRQQADHDADVQIRGDHGDEGQTDRDELQKRRARLARDAKAEQRVQRRRRS